MEAGEDPSGEALQIIGKVKGDELERASLTPLGGCYFDEDEIGTDKITDKLIPESQVPPEIR